MIRLPMTQISRFTGESVPIAQVVTGDGDESAAPEGGGGFADDALVPLYCLRIYLDSSYRMTINLLKEMPQITGEVDHEAADTLLYPRCVRRSTGSVCACVECFREFREIGPVCVVYNIKRAVT